MPNTKTVWPVEASPTPDGRVSILGAAGREKASFRRLPGIFASSEEKKNAFSSFRDEVETNRSELWIDDVTDAFEQLSNVPAIVDTSLKFYLSHFMRYYTTDPDRSMWSAVALVQTDNNGYVVNHLASATSGTTYVKVNVKVHIGSIPWAIQYPELSGVEVSEDDRQFIMSPLFDLLRRMADSNGYYCESFFYPVLPSAIGTGGDFENLLYAPRELGPNTAPELYNGFWCPELSPIIRGMMDYQCKVGKTWRHITFPHNAIARRMVITDGRLYLTPLSVGKGHSSEFNRFLERVCLDRIQLYYVLDGGGYSNHTSRQISALVSILKRYREEVGPISPQTFKKGYSRTVTHPPPADWPYKMDYLLCLFVDPCIQQLLLSDEEHYRFMWSNEKVFETATEISGHFKSMYRRAKRCYKLLYGSVPREERVRNLQYLYHDNLSSDLIERSAEEHRLALVVLKASQFRAGYVLIQGEDVSQPLLSLVYNHLCTIQETTHSVEFIDCNFHQVLDFTRLMTTTSKLCFNNFNPDIDSGELAGGVWLSVARGVQVSKCLCRLHIHRCQVPDESFIHTMRMIRYSQTLSTIDVSHQLMSTKVFTALCAFISMSDLRSFRLRGNLSTESNTRSRVKERIERGTLLLHTVASNRRLLEVDCDSNALARGQYLQLLADVNRRNVDRYIKIAQSPDEDRCLKFKVIDRLLVEQRERPDIVYMLLNQYGYVDYLISLRDNTDLAGF